MSTDQLYKIVNAVEIVIEKKDEYEQARFQYDQVDASVENQCRKVTARGALFRAIEDLRTAYK